MAKIYEVCGRVQVESDDGEIVYAWMQGDIPYVSTNENGIGLKVRA